ncbi:hypothetical protein HDU67_003787 [Dinochytrium kinnereticum]|nr:hypothetical protein HDU67_003787 [Dinochytrium kinnereticum]
MEEEVLRQLSQVDSLKFRWIHDRMQQAAYVTISETDIPILHLDIGTMLLDQVVNRCHSYSPQIESGSIDRNERQTVLEIADHFSKTAEKIRDMESLPRGQRDRIAMVLFQAGALAFKAASMDAAQRFFIASISFLGQDAWNRQSNLDVTKQGKDGYFYRLCFEAHLRGFVSASMNNDDASGKPLFETARKNVKDSEGLAKLLIEEALRRTYREPKNAMKACKDALRAIGLGFIGAPPTWVVLKYLLQAWRYVSKFSVEQIVNFKEMTNPRDLLVCELLAHTEREQKVTTVLAGLYTLVLQMKTKSLHQTIVSGMKASKQEHLINPLAVPLLSFGLYILNLSGPEDQRRIGDLIVALSLRYPKTPEATIGLWAAYAADYVYVEDYRPYLEKLYEVFYVGVKEAGEQSASNHSAFLWAIGRLWMY